MTDAVPITYARDRKIDREQFVDLLVRSTLGERRPIDDDACVDAMLANANLTITAWEGDRLVGIARSVTDFAYCCYLSDLAVDSALQRSGVGRELIRLTQAALGPKAKVILLSAPKAVDYYPRIGFVKHPNAYMIDATAPLE
ncbi:GNAT family N-acetyltransferase [Pararobbsia silviterrae]|uniref:GNAT family N-acetyltransferase n=1 Tax=Pararobbsia silviterrae TaxID=1792498 RepID=A0A494XG70_9BURK|nr:GNAT family N-acetyltransferase [Pararobbsia silviterrae]RKP49745.1 GNAT family N-acetyltransferase [Pararobbsia silviterrae]